MNQKGALPLIIILVGIILAATAVGIGIASQANRQSTPPGTSGNSSSNSPLPVSENSNTNLTVTKFDPRIPTEDQIKADPKLKSTTVLSDGSTQYVLNSANVLRDNLYIFKDQKLVFMRQLASETNSNPPLASFAGEVGAADRVVTGSNYYGPLIQIRIYALKGYALTVKPFTDEVYEFQRFTATSIEYCLSKWGNDYNPNTKLL